MSGTLPTSPGPKDAELISDQPTFTSKSETGKRQARNAGGHQWFATFNYPLLNRDEFEPINAFIMAQRGELEEFQVVMPQKATPRGVATGSPTVAVPAIAEDTTIIITGFTINTPGILKAGDVIKFASHSKVYMNITDLDANSSGACVATIEPPLVQPLGAGEVVTVNNVPFTMSVIGLHKYKTRNPMVNTYKLKMEESL